MKRAPQNCVFTKKMLFFRTATKLINHLNFQVKALNNEKEELMVANKSLAEYNLTQEPILKRKKEQLTTKHSDAVQLLATVNALKDELASKSGKIQPDVLYNLLEVSTIFSIPNF